MADFTEEIFESKGVQKGVSSLFGKISKNKGLLIGGGLGVALLVVLLKGRNSNSGTVEQDYGTSEESQQAYAVADQVSTNMNEYINQIKSQNDTRVEQLTTQMTTANDNLKNQIDTLQQTLTSQIISATQNPIVPSVPVAVTPSTPALTGLIETVAISVPKTTTTSTVKKTTTTKRKNTTGNEGKMPTNQTVTYFDTKTGKTGSASSLTDVPLVGGRAKNIVITTTTHLR